MDMNKNMTKRISLAARALTMVMVAALLLAGSAAALTDDRFRVGPSVTLRPVTDVIDTNQDAIVELYMVNSNLNDVALNVDARIGVPDGIHVSGEGFSQAGSPGIVAGTFKVLPGDQKSINIIFKADKSARFGSHTIQITGLYWPGDNKDNFQPLSLKYSVTVKEPTIQTPTPKETPVELHGEKTDVELGDDIILKLSVVNLISKPAMTVQVILIPPSGMPVTSSDFVKSGAGQYTATYTIDPGLGRDTEVRIKANQAGDFEVKGRVIYYFGGDRSTVEDSMLNLPIKVRAPVTAAPLPTAAPKSSNSYIYAGIVGLVLILVAIVALKRRSSSKVEEPLKREPTVKPEPQKPTPLTDSPKIKPAPISAPEASGVYVKTAFGYKGAAIIYKLKIENNTSDPISDIKVYPYVPDVFLLREKEKSIALIEPKSSQTVTFEIRPTGECGDCNVSGRVNYYDMASRKRQDIELEQKSLSIVCPMLHGKEISETEWHDTVSNLVKTEESTREIDMPAESLFTMVSRIVKDMHMHMQKPEVTQNHKLFNGVARFYGEGVKGLKYAAQVEVVGGAKKSKLILKVWAEKEDALTGFYHGMLDEIEKRVNVKEYIDDSIVQYNVHIGDKIGTLVKDSVVQRSNIGAAVRKCPNCGREVEANEKFCLECGAKL
ncbi:MAG: zinc ribbon domain-containing protein [Candidatus Methanoperedens sp.]|nr:zinc ribbon domain-containing protein [Candidatus Methanoperedens sp.]